LAQIFSASNLLSKATMPEHDGFGGYDFILVLNHERDETGILNSYVKGVLTAARWGFDVKLPNGTRVGQVMLHVVDPNLPKGTVEVIVDDDSCEYSDSIFLKGNKGNERIVATYRGSEIGTIINKYPEFWAR
jgi:hypothetical protein